MISLKDYQEIIGKKNINKLKALARLSRGKKVVMVNSTKDGGGVAEILHRLVPLINELDINCSWETINGNEGFFNVTKNIHNALADPERIPPIMNRRGMNTWINASLIPIV